MGSAVALANYFGARAGSVHLRSPDSDEPPKLPVEPSQAANERAMDCR